MPFAMKQRILIKCPQDFCSFHQNAHKDIYTIKIGSCSFFIYSLTIALSIIPLLLFLIACLVLLQIIIEPLYSNRAHQKGIIDRLKEIVQKNKNIIIKKYKISILKFTIHKENGKSKEAKRTSIFIINSQFNSYLIMS